MNKRSTQSFATCGHDITQYPWDWPGVWTQGFHDGGIGPAALWSYSILCFNCVMNVQKEPQCRIQFTVPEEIDRR